MEEEKFAEEELEEGEKREQEKSEERCWSRKVGGQAWSGGSLWKSVLKIEDQPRVLPDFL